MSGVASHRCLAQIVVNAKNIRAFCKSVSVPKRTNSIDYSFFLVEWKKKWQHLLEEVNNLRKERKKKRYPKFTGKQCQRMNTRGIPIEKIIASLA